jgi:hypothetical protein
MATRVFKPESFSRVALKGPGKLQVIQSASSQLIVRAADELVDEVEFSVIDNELSLGFRNSRIVPLQVWRQQVTYELYTPDLNAIALKGSGVIETVEFDTDQLALKLSGSGTISIGRLTADKIRLELDGSGTLKISGDVESQTMTINGSGSYQAENLVSDFACIQLKGSGFAAVCVADHLDVFIGGSGKVNYHGFPDITKRIFGSGALNRVRKVRRAVVAE